MSEPDSRVIPFESTVDGPLSGLLSYPEGGFQISGEYEPHPLFERGRFHPSGPWLVYASRSVIESRSIKVHNYAVMTDPRCRDLHRTFANLASGGLHKTTKIVKFANRFGWLGDSEIRFELSPARWSSLPQDLFITGENYWGWWKRIHELAALTLFWDCVLNEDRSELSKYITWEGTPQRVRVYFAYRDGHLTTDRSFFADWRTTTYQTDETMESEAIADERVSSGRYRFVVFPALVGPRFDILKAAELFLYDQINDYLWNNVSPQLRAERSPGEALMLVPHNLLAAIYLDFAREMSGRLPLAVSCANPKCHRVVVPRWGRRYCSDRCRSQSHYYRRRARDQPFS